MIKHPSYLDLRPSGELRQRAESAYDALRACLLCPRACGVDRLAGQAGYCRATTQLIVASWNLHPWEEPPISGQSGSGTIFFSGCAGRCLFCQNYPISQMGVGRRVCIDDLARMMLELQERGAHNINLVTGTHYIPHILRAVDLAAGRGLSIPIVHNSSGWETIEALRLLENVVDIYLPDAKYADDGIARSLSGFVNYVETNRAAIREMYRQVGPELQLDEEGIARRGMIIRHMVLPGNLAGSADVFRWIATELSPTTLVSVMSQYFPAHKALGHRQLDRKITVAEYDEAVEAFFEAGLTGGWCQDLEHEDYGLNEMNDMEVPLHLDQSTATG